ncbi:MAG: hypothetical protein QM500_12300 [Methylococcales bacterium]
MSHSVLKEIKTLADLKRNLVIGHSWECVHQYVGDHPSEPKSLGVRKIGYKDTVKFGFESARTPGEFSYSNWPKKSELTIVNAGQFIIENECCKLIYTFVNE